RFDQFVWKAFDFSLRCSNNNITKHIAKITPYPNKSKTRKYLDKKIPPAKDKTMGIIGYFVISSLIAEIKISNFYFLQIVTDVYKFCLRKLSDLVWMFVRTDQRTFGSFRVHELYYMTIDLNLNIYRINNR